MQKKIQPLAWTKSVCGRYVYAIIYPKKEMQYQVWDVKGGYRVALAHNRYPNAPSTISDEIFKTCFDAQDFCKQNYMSIS